MLASAFFPPLQKGPLTDWVGLHGAACGLAVAYIVDCGGLIIVVARDNRRLQLLQSELQFYRSNQNNPPLVRMPHWECLPYDFFPQHEEIISERLRTLSSLTSIENGVLLTTADALMQRLRPPHYIHSKTFTLRPGDELNIDEFRNRLQSSGYLSVTQVMGPSEYAIRGGVIDIFSMSSNRPFRLDLFGAEIESIRYFELESQRSSEPVDKIEIMPTREYPITKEAIRKFRENFRVIFDGDPHCHTVYQDISNGRIPPGIDFYFPLFFSETSTIFDYIKSNAHWIIDDGVTTQLNSRWANVQDRYANACRDLSRIPLKPNKLYLDPIFLEEALRCRNSIFIGENITKGNQVQFNSQLPAHFPVDINSLAPYETLISHIKKCVHRILLVAETSGRRQALEDILAQYDITPSKVLDWDDWLTSPDKPKIGIVAGDIERGLRLPNDDIEVITESQIYGERFTQRRLRSRQTVDPESIIRSLAELSIGDPVVHEEQGVGRYRGLTTLGIDEQQTEFLILEYQDGDRLYVPIISLDLISRYVGGERDSIPLHKLGTDAWERAKNRAREKIYDVAVELLEMHALRSSRLGYSFKIPEEDYASFVARFPFEETPDQERAMSEVLTDLASKSPMDRIVCGDVGFGKTEIALRAAFIAALNNKQVAILVPTTILAQQHFETFQDRFAELPIQVDLLSRFRKKSAMDGLVKSLPKGFPDILIGTHRLLQNDIKFGNLGLLIIDEEHRFGVRQKEFLKKIRKEVDVLTLTATPIPRTLNIGLTGLRSISLISTPPTDRRSIKTFVCPWDNALVREACLREIHRGGQVFILHNKVRTLGAFSKRLMKLIPEADIRLAHGQMPKRQLEYVMRDFYHRRFQILLCTTIIESGIDLPNVNTIVVARADSFGLAQLHQLRGRVGRSKHQAYAYLMTAPSETLREDARKRLDVISNLEGLGAGFALASHDLEIRGTGELLGEAQSGTIDEIGFTLYSEYLSRAIQDLSDASQPKDIDGGSTNTTRTELQFNTPALFPDVYLPDVHARLVFYKRVAAAKDVESLNGLQLEAIDRFGPLPRQAKSLFRLSKLQVLCQTLGIRRFVLDKHGGNIDFDSDLKMDPECLVEIISSQPTVYRMASNNSIRVDLPLPDGEDRLDFADSLISQLVENCRGS